MRNNNDGAGLLETAVAMPVLFAIAFNIINLAYFWFMVLTLSAAPRQAVQFSVQGGAASDNGGPPKTDAVSQVVFDNMTNAVKGATSSNTAVRVCAANSFAAVNTTIGTGCDPYGNTAFTFPAPTTACCKDPEAPFFVMNRVDVEFTVTPIIPGAAFGVLLPSNLKFSRHVSMRSLF
jgi:Flp pilus assembly protein TadG